MENTLLIGNGFSRMIFKNTQSWSNLFENKDIQIDNFTFLYELLLLNEYNAEDNLYKLKITEKIGSEFGINDLRDGVKNLDRFGEFLKENNIQNIITTNFEESIEFILEKLCGYKKVNEKGDWTEDIYSVRRHFVFKNKDHELKLWKARGDTKNIASILLGFDQYCGSLGKLSNYIKGEYKYDENSNYKSVGIEEKCSRNEFDHISWAELLFCTNVYIIGFGMDYSEIDIWWLLNKRARIKKKKNIIENQIYFLFNPIYDDPQKVILLDHFDVSIRVLSNTKDYLQSVYSMIKDKSSSC